MLGGERFLWWKLDRLQLVALLNGDLDKARDFQSAMKHLEKPTPDQQRLQEIAEREGWAQH